MKYWYLSPLLFYFIGISNAQIPEDKLKHLGAGVLIGGISGLGANQLFNGDRYWTWSAALGGSLAAGVAKEGYDKSRGGPWDNGDILYTVIGGIVSGLVFELFVNKSGCRRSGRPCKYYSYQFDTLPKRTFEKPYVIFIISDSTSGNLISNVQAEALLNASAYSKRYPFPHLKIITLQFKPFYFKRILRMEYHFYKFKV